MIYFFAECGFKPVDMIFVLDASGSVRYTDFEKELSFVQKFAEEFDIGPLHTQIGVITYNGNVYDHVHLHTFTDKSSLINGITNIPYYGGGTETADALNVALTQGFAQRNGDRDHVTNILIVVTDGYSNDPQQTATMAKQVHNAGIETIAVGVGTNVNYDEMRVIASDPKYVFHVSTYNALQTLQGELKDYTCIGNTYCFINRFTCVYMDIGVKSQITSVIMIKRLQVPIN